MKEIRDIQKVHMVGVGGIGMSGLARLFLCEKKDVSGSDRETSDITKALEDEGITLFPRQDPQNIADDIDLVVYTEAMPEDHPELARAREKKIPTLNYFEALGAVANKYYLVAIAGTHGKTTTTAMTVDVLEAAELDPTAIVGSLRAKTRSNFRFGKSKYFVVEACEYRRDFLSLKPDVLVITNIEEEHLDYFKDLADIQKAFGELTKQINKGGVVVCNPADLNVTPILSGSGVGIIDYTKYLDPLLKLTQPGMHNYMNAAAARAVGEFIGVSREVAHRALEEFSGTWRRFEYKGKIKSGALVYDDYGHHPTEIKATLGAARETFKNKKLVVAFQPHLYSRTNHFFSEFVDALSIADVVLIAPVYRARSEKEDTSVHERLAIEIQKKGTESVAIDSVEALIEAYQPYDDDNTLLITLGAGDTYKVADALTKEYAK